MIHAAVFLCAQNVTAVVREVPGDGAPRIVCDGTSGLPDGSLLDLKIYYGAVEPGRELQGRSVQVRNGAFSREFAVFPGKNLAGSYVLRIEFRPEDTEPWTHSVSFQIGTPEEAERDRARILDQLAGDIREIVALADTTAPFPRALSIAQRCSRSPEYRAIRLQEIAGPGLQDLCKRLRSATAPQATRQARDAFDRAAQRHLDRLAAERIGADVLRGLAEDLNAKLRKASLLSGGSLEAARKIFTTALLDLQAKTPARHHAALVDLASAAPALFDESRSKEERERVFHQEVEPQVLRLIQGFAPAPSE